MSKSDRRKAAEAQHEALKASLRTKLTIGDGGKVLKPGTREYERELERLMVSLSPDELDEITRKGPNAKRP
jgi:hypothetical protein